MGGHAAGDLASRTVRDTVLEKARPDTPLPETVRAAHAAVVEAARRDQSAKGMGSTVAAARLHRGRAEVTWVGDSRVYLLRDGRLQRLTTDHSYVQYLVDRGELDPADAATHPERNVLIRTLGFDEPEADQVFVDLMPEDRLLLCTDGLSGEIAEPRMVEILLESATPQAAADALVEEVVRQRGNDDATAVVIRHRPRSAVWPALVGVAVGVAAFLFLMWMTSS
jgi:protein phosphatase